ncbi:MAG: hypothetical protein QOJ07_288 [Thermoleophilaceae bacterium]|nr:hypothetical protein [Thermoleophilaceae bacterium]
MLDRLTVDSFRPAVGQPFVLDLDGVARVELELVEARTHVPDAPALDANRSRSPFSLVFRGPAEPVLPQRIYRIEHAVTGPLELFIVPVARDADGMSYEALFG